MLDRGHGRILGHRLGPGNADPITSRRRVEPCLHSATRGPQDGHDVGGPGGPDENRGPDGSGPGGGPGGNDGPGGNRGPDGSGPGGSGGNGGPAGGPGGTGHARQPARDAGPSVAALVNDPCVFEGSGLTMPWATLPFVTAWPEPDGHVRG
jgi:hypothetical protein